MNAEYATCMALYVFLSVLSLVEGGCNYKSKKHTCHISLPRSISYYLYISFLENG